MPQVGEALRGVPRSSYFIISNIPSGLNGTVAAEALELALLHLGAPSAQSPWPRQEGVSDRWPGPWLCTGLPSVDLMLIHHPNAAPGLSLTESLQQQWAALEAFHSAGKARAIGTPP